MDIFALETGECVKLQEPEYNEAEVLVGYKATNANEEPIPGWQGVFVGIDRFLPCPRFLARCDLDRIA